MRFIYCLSICGPYVGDPVGLLRKYTGKGRGKKEENFTLWKRFKC